MIKVNHKTYFEHFDGRHYLYNIFVFSIVTCGFELCSGKEHFTN